MKAIFKKTLALLIIIAASSIWTACEKEDVSVPGLSVEISEIKTYGGGQVTVEGTASDVTGIDRIEIVCAPWDILKTFDLSNYKPKVFNYLHTFTVPQDAGENFNHTLTIRVIDIDGKETSRSIPVTFIADSQAPVFVTKPPVEVAVDFFEDTNSGSYNLNVTLSDDRALHSLNIKLEAIGFDETVELSGLSQTVTKQILFDEPGNFPMVLTATDKTGNEATYTTTLVVIRIEPEEPISDYARMYVINTNQSPDNYILGYYQYMRRVDEYKYYAMFYAPEANTKIAFTSTQSITGDYYGISPYVSTKLFNSNGYVLPINIAEKGYYYIDINLLEQSYEIRPATPEPPTFTGLIHITGVGFSHADWTMSPAMTKIEAGNNHRHEITLEVVRPANEIVTFCFADASWNPQWKPDGNAGGPASIEQLTGWSVRTSGGNFEDLLQGPGTYRFTFDLATMWATVSAKQ